MTFIENLNWRYATKKFNGEKISDKDLQKIKDAVRLSPSSSGLQPTHVFIISDKEKLEHLKKFSTNQTKFETCSHMFVFCYRTDMMTRQAELAKIKAGNSAEMWNILSNWRTSLSVSVKNITRKKEDTKDWSMAQTYLALGFGLAACAELKIDSCPMEGFESLTFQKELDLPDHIVPCVLMAVGTRAIDDKVFEKTRFPESDFFTEIK